jgi:hypothetical protein
MVNAVVYAVAIAINVFGIIIAIMGLIVPVMNARRPAPRKAAAVRLTVVRPAIPSLDEQPSVHPAPLLRAYGDDVRSGGLLAA